jgi:hypothetical protein
MTESENQPIQLGDEVSNADMQPIQIEEEISNIKEASINSAKTLAVNDIPILKERTRTWLAITLVVGLEVTFAAIGVFIYFTQDDSIKRELTTLVLTSEVTLVSSALGFYFGSQER